MRASKQVEGPRFCTCGRQMIRTGNGYYMCARCDSAKQPSK